MPDAVFFLANREPAADSARVSDVVGHHASAVENSGHYSTRRATYKVNAMCSNYHPVTQMDRLLTFFGVERDRNDPPQDIFLNRSSLNKSFVINGLRRKYCGRSDS